MKCKILYTTGNGKFEEQEYVVEPMKDNEIRVKTIMTGVCRSDIDMMIGNFGPLPIHMQGHEGLAQVLDVGSNVKGAKTGDYVATRGEPAYADYYNVRDSEFVVVPDAHPRYILEPVACGINIVDQDFQRIIQKDKAGARCLILGSGFLAYVAYARLNDFIRMPIDVVGSANKDLWGDKLQNEPNGKYDVVIDLSSKTDIFDKDILQDNAMILFGVEKQITTNFANLLWKACTMIFPSPRTPYFHTAMVRALNMIERGILDVDRFWTKCYNRSTEWQDAFRDGLERPTNYSRGYIVWD